MSELLLEAHYDRVTSLGVHLRTAHPDVAWGPDSPAAELFDSVVVGRRHAPLGQGGAQLGSGQAEIAALRASPASVATQVKLLHAVASRNVRAGVRCCLAKGFRISYGSSHVAADGLAPVAVAPGSTHCDQFLTREWIALLDGLGTVRLAGLLDGATVSLFRRLPNGCLLQLTGIPLDVEIRLATTAPPPFPPPPLRER
jgi:hypothetical protein